MLGSAAVVAAAAAAAAAAVAAASVAAAVAALAMVSGPCTVCLCEYVLVSAAHVCSALRTNRLLHGWDANQVFAYTTFVKPECNPLLGRHEGGKVDQGEAIYEGLARVRLLVVWELKRRGGSLPEGFVWRFLECGGAKEVQPSTY